MNLVAAVVINRNTRGFLRSCLDSLEGQEFDGGISVWVVDNGSTDGSPEMVLREYPGTDLVWNERNVGYARACNQALVRTAEPYVLIMNSDTVLSPDTVSSVVRCFERNAGAGIVGPRILNTDGTVQFSVREFPSLKDAFMHAFLGLFRAENPYTSRYRMTTWDHESEREVDWVSGAFMGLRREAAETLKGFDEGYYMYVEDVDVCWRAGEAGWKVLYLPSGDVTHHIGQSSGAVSNRMMFHHHMSMLRFHVKTYRGPARPLVNSLVALGVAARFILIAALNLFYRARGALGGARRRITPGRQ